jgi:hypothetical protein
MREFVSPNFTLLLDLLGQWGCVEFRARVETRGRVFHVKVRVDLVEDGTNPLSGVSFEFLLEFLCFN